MDLRLERAFRVRGMKVLPSFDMFNKISKISGALILLVLPSATLVIDGGATPAQEATRVQNFEMDPFFFQNLQNGWPPGKGSGISVDTQDHIWFFHRPATVAEGE